jgi:hypothetical protein
VGFFKQLYKIVQMAKEDKIVSEGNLVEEEAKGTKKQRKRINRSFPAGAFEDSLEIANVIQEHAAGKKMRRLTLFEQLGKSPDSGSSRQLVTNSAKYGLTKGSYTSDYLELTPEGFAATSNETDPREKLQAKFRLAIYNIPSFKLIYDQYTNVKLPSKNVLMDFLKEKELSDQEVSECADIFIVNAKYLGLLTTLAGAERLLPIEHLLENIKSESVGSKAKSPEQLEISNVKHPRKKVGAIWERTCFYIAPIGEADSEMRQHSDLFLSSIVEPALAEFGLDVVRADKISDPGIITAQIVEHVLKSCLVVADLSFHESVK